MPTPDPAAGGPGPIRPAPEPTVRVARPPAPGARPGVESTPRPARPAHPDDESTVGIPRATPGSRQRTIKFGTPAPAKVTVTARPRPRRRHRTWPWIAAVVGALLVLGVVLLVMLMRGATVEGHLGSAAGAAAVPGTEASPQPGGRSTD